MKIGWGEMRGGVGHCPRREGVSMTANVVLLLVVLLLAMVLLLVRCLMLVLVCHAHLHISLMSSPTIHHHMLPLLVALIEHSVRIV